MRSDRKPARRSGVAVALLVALCACSANPVDKPPPTVAPASAAVSPPVTTPPAGVVHPLPLHALAALFDAATSSLVVLGADRVAVLAAHGGEPRSVPLPAPATALTGDNHG